MEAAAETQMDINNLYREESISDLKVGAIRVMTPITPSGDFDSSREIQYIGSAQIMTPAGAMPIQFELDNQDLTSAVNSFSEKSKIALEDTVKELKEMQRQAASSIVVPGAGGQASGGIQIP